MIRFSCACGRQLQAPESSVGQEARCPMCGKITVIPGADESRPGPNPPAPAHAPEDRSGFGYTVRESESHPRTEFPDRRVEPDEDASPRRSRNPFARSGGVCKEAQNALILGVVSLFCCNFVGVAAVALGAVALVKINASGGELEGKGQAIVGIVLGTIALAISAVYFVTMMFG